MVIREIHFQKFIFIGVNYYSGEAIGIKWRIMMKILNIGSMNVDYTYRVNHFAQPGETLSSGDLLIGCGGKGLNQSIAIARAGLPIWHAGFYGDEGDFLVEKLLNNGVHIEFLKRGYGKNGHAIIQVDQLGQNSIILYGGTNNQFSNDYIDSILSNFGAGDILVLQNEINNLPYIMEQAYLRGLSIAFNAAPYNENICDYPLHYVRWLIVNEIEAGYLSGETEQDGIIKQLLRRYPESGILLTLGERGSVFASKNESVCCPAFKTNVVDTTAAGDVFIGYFLRGVVDQLPMECTLRLASAASAIAITRQGAAESIPIYSEVVSDQRLA